MLSSADYKAPSLERDLPERDSFFFCALSMLLTRNPNSLVPEIMYFMNPSQVLTFMQAFGGRKIEVPTVAEFSIDMDCALAAYYRLSYGLTWEAIAEKLELNNGPRIATVKSAVEKWMQTLEQEGIKIPEFLRDNV